ncbi:MAG: TRAP transporter substrate-binding protein, partial [Paracoccaceae bacterium]|nr:TRAP transporter substrate-binding protein [Paracoccaceae bacterium]
KNTRVLALATAVLLTMAPVAGAQTRLIMDSYAGPAHPLTLGVMKPLAEAVEKATQGRVTIEVSSAPLGKSNTQWEQVESGISDIAVQYIGWRRSEIQLPAISAVPFTVPSGEIASAALWRTQNQFFTDADEFKGMKLLGLVVQSGAQIYTRGHKFSTIADFSGLKIRAAPGETADLVSLLGSSPVATQGPQIFEFFSKGVVDAVLDGGHGPTSFKIVDYIKVATQVPGSFGALTFALFMNEAKFNALSPEDQQAILSVSGEEISRRGGQEFDRVTADGIAQMTAAGAEFYTPDDAVLAELRTRLQPIEENWIKIASTKGVDGNAALEYYRAQLAELAK